jgi:hypothetical protein
MKYLPERAGSESSWRIRQAEKKEKKKNQRPMQKPICMSSSRMFHKIPFVP